MTWAAGVADGDRMFPARTARVLLGTGPSPLLTAVSGDGQSAPVGTPLAQPLVVRAAGELGNPAAGAPVVFRVVQGNGSLGNGRRSEVATTDADGLARTTFVLGTRSGVGTNRVRATAPDFDGEVVFTAAATPAAPASVHVVTGDNQRAGPGQALAEPLTVLVIDDGGNPVKGVPVSFEILKGSGTVDGEATGPRVRPPHSPGCRQHPAPADLHPAPRRRERPPGGRE